MSGCARLRDVGGLSCLAVSGDRAACVHACSLTLVTRRSPDAQARMTCAPLRTTRPRTKVWHPRQMEWRRVVAPRTAETNSTPDSRHPCMRHKRQGEGGWQAGLQVRCKLGSSSKTSPRITELVHVCLWGPLLGTHADAPCSSSQLRCKSKWAALRALAQGPAARPWRMASANRSAARREAGGGTRRVPGAHARKGAPASVEAHVAPRGEASRAPRELARIAVHRSAGLHILGRVC